MGDAPSNCGVGSRAGNPNPYNYRGVAGRNAYERFERDCDAFADVLDGLVRSIRDEAQQFYETHFARDGEDPLTIRLLVTRRPSYTFRTRTFLPPVLRFGVEIKGPDGRTKGIERPQVYFNEAKLTQLALSIRFAASLVNLHESAIKLLVLDDLLISLDMSNRMKVVEILLSETFEDYQKVFMTHDLGFFQECERRIGAQHTNWKYVSLQGLPSDDEITVKVEKSDLQKAEGYIRGHDYDEAALALRKASETIVRRFLDDEVWPTKKFSSLDGMLREAKTKLNQELPLDLYSKVLKDVPEAHRSLVVAPGTSDIDGHPTLTGKEKHAVKQARERLQSFCSGDVATRLQMLSLIDSLLATKDRVLNPAAHAGLHPIYEWEVRHAFDLIKQLGETLDPPPSL